MGILWKTAIQTEESQLISLYPHSFTQFYWMTINDSRVDSRWSLKDFYKFLEELLFWILDMHIAIFGGDNG